MMLYLVVDGMLSGTGVRDAVEGGYLVPGGLGVSNQLTARIAAWLARYEDAHYHQFEDKAAIAALDAEGVAICRLLRAEIPEAKIDYFSAAEMRKLTVTPA